MDDETAARNDTAGFIGAGNMAEAIARGILNAGLYPAASLRASDPAARRRNLFRAMSVECMSDNRALVAACDVLIMAIKPQSLPVVLKEIGPCLKAQHLLITICAGCPTKMFEAAAKATVRVVRAMPNTPLQVGMGATAIAAGCHATEADMELAEAVFGAVGKVVQAPEHLMDAVTALSGSGPAYFYFLVEALIDAGEQHGLSRQVARDLAIQTARGAAEMMLRTGLPPEELRHRVTSPGGTTAAAIRCFEANDVRQTVAAALMAAVERGKELGRQKKK